MKSLFVRKSWADNRLGETIVPQQQTAEQLVSWIC